MSNNGNNSLEESQNKAQERKNSIARQVGEKVIKKAGKHGAKNVVTQKAMGFLLQFAPIIGYILIAILIIFIVIGLISFLLTMPGLMSDKLKTFGDSITTSFKSIFMKDSVAKISDSDIVDLANYIKEMDYDVIGFGFVKPTKENGGYKISEELINDGYERITDTSTKDSDGKPINKVFYKKPNGEQYSDNFFDSDGTLYNGQTGEKVDLGSEGEYTRYGIKYDNNDKIKDLKGVDTSILKTYAISNRSIYVLRNDDDGFYSKIFNFISNFISGQDYNSWANGLVRIYEAENSIAKEEFLKDVFHLDNWFDVVKYEGTNLKLKKSSIFNSNNALTFDTEGWTGRYGLSQDFLISLHLATLSPEFVQTIVQTFDTEVQVYLDSVEDAKAEVEMIDTSSTVIGEEGKGLKIDENAENSIQKIVDVDDKGLDIDSWWISRKEAARFYKEFDIDSPNTCTYSYEGGLPDRVFPWDTDELNHFKNDDSCRISSLENYYKKYVESTDYFDDQDSMNISEIVNKFAKNLSNKEDNFGFNIADFTSKVKLNDDNKCKTSNLIKNFDHKNDLVYNEYGYRILRPSKSITNRLNSGFFSENGYNGFGAFSWSQSDYERLLYNRGLFDNSDRQSNYIKDYVYMDYVGESISTDHIRLGETCAFEEGKFKVNDSGITADEIITYPDSDHMYERYNSCECKFCQTFWKKYMSIYDVNACFVDAENEGFMEYATNNIDGEDDFIEYVSDLYSWDYQENGQIFTYNISFYRGISNNIELVLNRSWSYKEKEEALKEQLSTDTCSKIIKEASDEDVEDCKVCSYCKRYIKHIVWSLKKVNDEKYSAYVPYIARVVGSWFRDTYFIIPNSKTDDAAVKDVYDRDDYDDGSLEGGKVKIIQNDMEFLEATGELWTEYIMDDEGDYARFIIDTTGELIKKDGLEDYINKLKEESYAHEGLNDEDEKKLRNLIQEEYEATTMGGDKIKAYAKWKASDEDEDANKLLEKYNISLVKIPVNKTISELESSEAENETIAWSAYTRNVSNSKEWQDVTINQDSPYYMRNVQGQYVGVKDDGTAGTLKFRVGLEGVFNIKQEQDAQRGMTNSKIKYLFKNKKYYKYDGTIPRAFEIKEDWEQCIGIIPITDSGEVLESITKVVTKSMLRPKTLSFWNTYWNVKKTGEDIKAEKAQLQETALNAYIDSIYYQSDDIDSDKFKFARDFDNDKIADIASISLKNNTSYNGLSFDEDTVFTNDPRNPNLISKIDLNADALSAFSILENTHTADADYAYRDLKELIVELEYFDKEDLTQPATDILEWILPESGSAGWPVKMYDKYNDYGTLIHSKEMYDNLNELIVDGISMDVVDGQIETEGSLAEPETETDTESKTKIDIEDEEDSDDIKSDELSYQIKEDDKLLSLARNISARADTDTNSSKQKAKETAINESEYCTVQTTLNGVTYKTFKQYSIPESNTFPAAGGQMKTISSSGCGICSMAALLTGYGHSDETPITLSDKLKENNATFAQSLDSMKTILKQYYSIDSEVISPGSNSAEDIVKKTKEAFSKGIPVIINVGYNKKTGGHDWTDSGGHFMLAIGEEEGDEKYKSAVDLIDSGFGPDHKPSGTLPDYTVYKNGCSQHLNETDALTHLIENYVMNLNGVLIPTSAPNSSSDNEEEGVEVFDGFEKGDAIVSPATAKIIEMGTTTVSNEDAEQIFESLYIVRDEESDENEEGENTDGDENDLETTADADESSPQKVFITESKKVAIEEKAKELEEDEESTFGKSYTTGYIKLEVIGKESVDKILSAVEDSDSKAGVKAFYEEYYNGKYDENNKDSKTSVNPICDSYTIYIEGIDFRLDQTKDDWTLENTILNDIITKTENAQKEKQEEKDKDKDKDKEKDKENDDDKENDSKEEKDDNSTVKITLASESSSEIESEESTEKEEGEQEENKDNTEASEGNGEVTKTIDNYTEKEIPKYYPRAKRTDMRGKETKKKNMPSVIKFISTNQEGNEERQIYIKAGTLLGLCGDVNIKIMMKDKDYAVVENVEDYLEIEEIGAESKKSNSVDMDLAKFFFIPYEGGTIVDGPKGVFDTRQNDGVDGVSIGIAQWTTHNGGDNTNNVPVLCAWLYEHDSNLCKGLQAYINMNVQQVDAAMEDIRQSFEDIDNKDHDRLLELELEYKTEEVNNWITERGIEWLNDRPASVWGTYASVINWMPNEGLQGNLSVWERALSESASDEENIRSLMKEAMKYHNQTRWPSQARLAIDLLTGDCTEEDLKIWLETKGAGNNDLWERYGETKNPNYLN